MTPAMTYTSGGAGNGFSPAAKVLVVNGQLTQAQYQDMQSGTYSGTVTVTVTP
jgi:spore coat protein U-like protein